MDGVLERKRTETSALPKGWVREEIVRKTGLSAGKIDVCYYSPSGKKIKSKPQLARSLGDSYDLSAFDFQTGKVNLLLIKKGKKQQKAQFDFRYDFLSSPLKTRDWEHISVITEQFKNNIVLQCSRGYRNDSSVLPPIRQTASIFKQPVTIHKTQKSHVKLDFKHGHQEKPKQVCIYLPIHI